MGAGEHQLEALRGAIEREHGSADVLDVWRPHWHAFRVFMGMADQWRVVLSPEGRLMYLGLDYAALPPVLQEHKRQRRGVRQPHRVLMRQLRTLAGAAGAALNNPQA